MSRGSRLRQIAWQAVLFASAVQGLTPDGRDLASRRALDGLARALAACGHDDRDGRAPADARPSPTDAGDRDETPPEVVLPGAPQTIAFQDRRPAASCGDGLATIGLRAAPGAADPRLRGAPRRPGPDDDPIASLCRLTC